MKNLIFLLFITGLVKAQDTLLFVTGEKKVVKVTEVEQETIKYRKTENPDGPSYIIKLNEIRCVKYAGGQIDSFPSPETKSVIKAVDNKPNKFTYYGTKIFYNSEPVSQAEFLRLVNNFPDENERNKMQHCYKQMTAHRDIATTSLVCGVVFGCLAVLVTNPYVTGEVDAYGIPTNNGVNIALVGIFSGAALRISGFAVSQSQRNKRKAKIREIVGIYNNDYIK